MRIVRTGPLTVIKDEGRFGHTHLGVAPSGAVDRGAYARANALVSNPPGAAVLECTLGGLRVSFDSPAMIVLTGTDAVLTVDGVRASPEEIVSVAAGAVVSVGMPKRGLRSYLAVRGGFDVPPVLGSRSTDRLAGIGFAVSVDAVLPIGSPGSDHEPDTASLDSSLSRLSEGPLEVDLGPRDDWFTAEAIEAFLSSEFVITPASDSVGLRLDGPALTRAITDELPSEGVVRGSVQVPPDGRPIIFQADHPVTGGYPVIAVLTPESADRAAQARPGARVRFVRAPA
ncbi:biotin-dependent carboxyltransferase family protein [Winogradskya consettensis]|uniref:Allophanate hydrolase n=1 Tax=Winogradskya consettensis TaxID=113560 RepID=A0A919W5J4_9ACTN|nr:biotin-dependent carboxyltransferase family protein [Actinoplanes consettensis]GIM80638.1 allophanate hydrolase [Actinoplanes consettensis]